MTRTFTPDHVETIDGRTVTRVTMKRACNGCDQFIGNVTDAEIERAIASLHALDVRDECPNCAPLIALELAGCRTWHVTPRSFTRVADEIDRLRPWVYTKGFWKTVDGELQVVGLRVGVGEGRVVAFWGDWIIRHPDGGYTVHTEPAGGAA